MMMTCECGNEFEGNFCPNCGRAKPVPTQPSVVTCSVCGQEYNGSFAFCPNCGTPKAKKPDATQINAPKVSEKKPTKEEDSIKEKSENKVIQFFSHLQNFRYTMSLITLHIISILGIIVGLFTQQWGAFLFFLVSEVVSLPSVKNKFPKKAVLLWILRVGLVIVGLLLFSGE